MKLTYKVYDHSGVFAQNTITATVRTNTFCYADFEEVVEEQFSNFWFKFNHSGRTVSVYRKGDERGFNNHLYCSHSDEA